MSKLWRSRLVLLALLLLVALAVLAVVRLLWFDWITDVLVVRAAYTLWLVGLVIRSRPQALFWSLPIVLGVVAMILLLARHVKIRRSVDQPPRPVGRVAEWAELLELAAGAPYFEKYLSRRVASLAERALQLEPRPHAERADDAAAVVMQTLPPEVKALLSGRSPPPGTLNSSKTGCLEVIVETLEAVLEVDHDR